jgi:hypothetical protein
MKIKTMKTDNENDLIGNDEKEIVSSSDKPCYGDNFEDF